MEKEVFAIVNRNHELRRTMDRIERDLEYVRLAKRLNQIPERRKKMIIRKSRPRS